mgnify:CR=1 FL=1
MAFEFSDFGTKLCGQSGILQLMDDLGKPLPPDIPSYQLGGGNPAQIPELAALYRAEMQKIMLEGTEFDDLIARYDAPQGRTAFIEAVASFLSKTYGWNIGPENVAITNGSQSAFFYLFNLFSGRISQGKNVRFKKIVLPLVPEYIGYADQTLEPGAFVSIPSHFKMEGDHSFKYHVNFELLENYLSKHDDVGALAVSRPTNPTGNVLTDEELRRFADRLEETMRGRLQRFGYVCLTAQEDQMGGPAGTQIRGHEFHYFDTDYNGAAYRALKPAAGHVLPAACSAHGNRLCR